MRESRTAGGCCMTTAADTAAAADTADTAAAPARRRGQCVQEETEHSATASPLSAPKTGVVTESAGG